MTGNEYQLQAMRTNDRKAEDRVVHKMLQHYGTKIDLGGVLDGCLGLSGEVGEFNDMIKKWIFHESDLNPVHLQKELGDVLWYVAMLCDSFGWNMEDIMKTNIDKLKERYPSGFDVNRSNHRKSGDV